MLITAQGDRIVLGTIARVKSVASVQESIIDATDPAVMIPMNKKRWPLVVNAITRLAEVQDVGSLSSRVEEWLQQFAKTCLPYAVASDFGIGSHEWKREKFPLFGTRPKFAALLDEGSTLLLHFDCFAAWCRDFDRGGTEVRPADIRQALADLGFTAGTKLAVEKDGRRIDRRAWSHPDGKRWL